MSSGSGGNGSFRLSLEPAPGGSWKCEVTFTFAGEEVKTIMRQVKVEQSKLEAVYDFDLLGNTLRSRITGEWNKVALSLHEIYGPSTAPASPNASGSTSSAACPLKNAITAQA